MLLKNSITNKIVFMRVVSFISSISVFSALAICSLSCSNVLKTTSYNVDISPIKNASSHIVKIKQLIPSDNSITSPIIDNLDISKKSKVLKNEISNKTLVHKIKINLKNKLAINTTSPIELKPIHVEKLKNLDWVASYTPIHFDLDTPKAIVASKRKVNHDENEPKEITISPSNLKKDEDRISTALAATEKSLTQTTLSNLNNSSDVMMNANSDDLIYFDYSSTEMKEKEVSNTLDTSASLTNNATIVTSNNVAKVQQQVNKLETEISKSFLNDLKKTKSIKKIAKDDSTSTIANLTEQNGFFKSLLENELNTQSITRVDNVTQSVLSEYSIKPFSIQLNKIEDLTTNFEIRFYDDIDDIVQDNGTGEINLKYLLNSNLGIRRGVLFSSSHMPMAMDLVLEGSKIFSRIPIISNEYFNTLIQNQKITGLGAHVLVELDDLTEDVNVDSSHGYEIKLFLDKKFNVVSKEDSDFNYVLFVGLKPGNVGLNYLTAKNEVVSKIVHVENDYIYFDSNYYVEINSDQIDLYEENLLSKNVVPLNIQSNEITNFSYNSQFSKKALNRYQIGKSIYPLGTRKYLELKHLEESIFLGFWDKKTIDVPSEEYMRFILSSFKTVSSNNQCLVQVNLTKSAKNIYINGSNGDSAMRVDQLLLDKDGLFYKHFGQNTRKIFILGYEQGVINMQVEYIDGSIDFLQTYCSNSTYLIEQI